MWRLWPEQSRSPFLANRGYDTDAIRAGWKGRGIIPSSGPPPTTRHRSAAAMAIAARVTTLNACAVISRRTAPWPGDAILRSPAFSACCASPPSDTESQLSMPSGVQPKKMPRLGSSGAIKVQNGVGHPISWYAGGRILLINFAIPGRRLLTRPNAVGRTHRPALPWSALAGAARAFPCLDESKVIDPGIPV